MSGEDGAISKDLSYVLDASAVLVYLRGDAGGAVVQRVLRQCQDVGTKAIVAAPALSDAYAAAAMEAPTAFDDLVPLVEQLPLEAYAMTAETARAVADLLARERGLSSGQATGLVLSKNSGATLVSADKALEGRPGVLYVCQDAGDKAAGDPAVQR